MWEPRGSQMLLALTPTRARCSRHVPGLRSASTEREDKIVSVLIRFAPPSLTAEKYDKAVARLREDGVLPAEGLDYEICFGEDGNLKVSQVWDTKEHMEAFGQRLMPILQDLGIDPGRPEIVKVHNIIKG
jgi:hypothetical protein